MIAVEDRFPLDMSSPRSSIIGLDPAARESWTVRSFQPGDEPQILALFKRVFNIEQSLQCWRWKFCDNPAGGQICLAVTDSGRIVGQYAGLPVLMHWNGERRRATHVVDVMVDPDFRAGLKKPGMFMKLGERFIQDAHDLDQSTLGFGFPPLHHLRIGRRLGYIERHEVNALVRPPDSSNTGRSGPPPSEWWVVDEVPAFDARVDRLWSRCRSDLPVAAIRDACYLNWRYARHPEVRYRILVVRRRRSEEWAGLAILRLGVGRFGIGERTACLVDWLVPLASRWPTELLLAHCIELAREAGMMDMRAWFRRDSPHWHLFAERGFRPEPTSLFFVAGQAAPDVRLDWGCDRWYYTMGDSDLV